MPDQSRTIDYYFSIHSPWAFLGHAPFSALAGRYGLKVNYLPVLLGDLFAETGGLPLARRHPARQRYRTVELKRWREARGIDFHLKPAHWPFDVALADKTVIAATLAGADAGALAARLFSGAWQRQENMADPEALLGALAELGLSGDLLVEATGARIADIYAGNRERAIAADVFGSPSYVLDGEVFWGQDRIDLLEAALSSGRPPFTSEF